MKITQEQFELLREFDTSDYCVGTKVIYADFDKGEICMPLNHRNEFVVNYEHEGYVVHAKEMSKNLRLMPLAWLEDKPVYKGDTLYYSGSANELFKQGTPLVFEDMYSDRDIAVLKGAGGILRQIRISSLSWEKVQVYTRWINCYPNGATVGHKSKEDADAEANKDRCDCICIQWTVK